MVHACSETFNQFIAALDRQLGRAPDCHAQVKATMSLLTTVLSKPDLLDESQLTRNPRHYTRHRLYSDPDDRFCVVAMVWGPGQGTPIHDHGGVWCVEGVHEGNLRITRYDLEYQDGTLHRFQRKNDFRAGVGQVGNLIPPVEYHVVHNESDLRAVSIHIYGCELKQCGRYLPHDDDVHHLRDVVDLWYDDPVGEA